MSNGKRHYKQQLPGGGAALWTTQKINTIVQSSIADSDAPYNIIMSIFYKRLVSGALSPHLSRLPGLTQRLVVSDCGGRNPNFSPSRAQSTPGYNVPPSAEFVARVSGIATMAKLPYRESAEGLDAAFVGVPIDTGTSNRPGAR